jgi:SlyX protein
VPKNLPMSDADRLERIEVKLAFQDDLIEQLNAVVSAQALELAQLRNRLALIESALKRLDPGRADATSDERPPHY